MVPRGALCGAVWLLLRGMGAQVRTRLAAKASNEMTCRGGARV